MGWATNKPTLDRLPDWGYRDNPVTIAAIDYPDRKLVSVKEQLEDFYLNLDPDTAQEKYLDLLAYLVCLSGQYWDIGWSASVKRNMIKVAYYLWTNKGTLAAIRKVLDIHGLQYDIWKREDLRMSFSLPGTFGKAQLKYFVRLKPKYRWRAKEWREAERTLENYNSAVVDAKVCYDGFYMGLSRLGDPMW